MAMALLRRLRELLVRSASPKGNAVASAPSPSSALPDVVLDAITIVVSRLYSSGCSVPSTVMCADVVLMEGVSIDNDVVDP